MYHFRPHPHLATCIETLWFYQGEAVSSPKERRLPDGSVELVINLSDDVIRVYDSLNPEQFRSYPGCIVSGPRSQFSLIDTISQTTMIGVHFKPGGFLPFCSLPVAELHNQTVSLDMLWGTRTFELRQQLLAARTPEQRFSLLEQALLSHLRLSRTVHPVIPFALKELQDVSRVSTIGAITEQIGISQTRFIQIFREAVGLTPKQFHRLQRFQHVLRVMEQTVSVDWVDLALQCGYFDQAHFIHDFQSFSGLTPTTYLALRGEHRNHVPISA